MTIADITNTIDTTLATAQVGDKLDIDGTIATITTISNERSIGLKGGRGGELALIRDDRFWGLMRLGGRHCRKDAVLTVSVV